MSATTQNQSKLYSDRHFSPFRESSQLHVIRCFSDESTGNSEDDSELYNLDCDRHILVINTRGKVSFKENPEDLINLRLSLPPQFLETKPEYTLELICADVSSEVKGDSIGLLLTFWVELSELYIPIRYFGALFNVSHRFDVNYCIELASMLPEYPVSTPIAYCRITERKPYTDNKHCCLVFAAGQEVSAFIVNDSTLDVEPLADVFSLFPELALSVLPGAATCSASSCSGGYRWSVTGFDSGFAVLSVSTIENNTIIDRKPIKFSGPISVLEFLPTSGTGEDVQQRRVLVSSTLGPVTVWRFWFEDYGLQWKHECILERSHDFDAVTCASVQGTVIAVGTFSGTVLFYALPFFGDGRIEANLVSQIELNAPVVSMKVFDNYEICVLSTAGLHIIGRPGDR